MDLSMLCLAQWRGPGVISSSKLLMWGKRHQNRHLSKFNTRSATGNNASFKLCIKIGLVIFAVGRQ